MSAKQLVSLSGTVEAVNAKGIRLMGEWCNFSQYHPINPMPTPGEIVEVQVETTDRGQWINTLRILGAAPAGPASAPGPDRTAIRLAVLQAAATFGSGYAQMREEVKS